MKRVALMRLVVALAALLALTVPVVAQSSNLAPTFEEAAALYSDENYSAAYEIAAPLATSGNVDAMIMLAEMYEQGLGRQADMANAIQWYDTAAAAGNVPAMFLVLGQKDGSHAPPPQLPLQGVAGGENASWTVFRLRHGLRLSKPLQ